MNFLKRLEQWRNAAPQIIQEKIEKIKNKLSDNPNMVTQIRPGLCHMPFPDAQLINPLSEFIKQKFGSNFFIWNLGEDTYDSEEFLNQVSHTDIKNYPVFPLANLLLIAVNIKNWVKQEGNIALVHCGNNKGRSALLLAVYLYLDGWHQYLQDAIIQVNRLLNINKNQTVFPSQHIFIKNCINLFKGFPINTKPLKLVRILINKIPQLADSDFKDKFNPYVQIFQLDKPLAIIQQHTNENQSITMNLNIEVTDDVVISIRHLTGPQDLYPCFRILFNTNFVTQNFIRINQNQLDLTKNIKPQKGFWIDFMFQSIEQEQSETRLSKVWDEVQKVFGLKIGQNNKSVRTIEQQHLKEQLKQMASTSLVEDAQNTSFAIDDVSPHGSKVDQPVQKQLEKIVLKDQSSEEEVEDIDDYIKQLEESIDYS